VFRIRHAAKLAGIKPTLLRAWERRYHLVEPQRTPSGYRVYSSADIEVLRAAASLVAAGHSISEVARLPRDELARAAARAEERGGEEAAPLAATTGSAAVETAIREALEAVARFDRAQLEAALFPVTTMAGLGPEAMCEVVLLPLLRAIGDAWEAGTLSVAAEHFGSALCRAKILQCLEFVARSASGPRVVCACPEHELHEGGLLAFAVHAAAARWQVVYLGANTPMRQALDTALRIDAGMVATSMTIAPSPAQLADLLTAVAEARARKPRLRVVAGGRAALTLRAPLEATDVEVFTRIGVDLAFETTGG
jgi:DNA-binding transcriptional MerR regulator/methylmalonyl-CoA mutase cobalamin-binding subunit